MSIGSVTLKVSGADVAADGSNNIVTASFTCTAGYLYLLCLSETASSNGVTAGQANTNWQYQKTQTAASLKFIELFGGLCTSTTTGTATLNWPAAGAIASYAIIEIQNVAQSATIVQKLSAADVTVTLGAQGAGAPATFLVGTNTTNAMTIESGYTQTTNIGTTHELLCGYKAAFDTTPSFTCTQVTPAIIGAEIADLVVGRPNSLMMTGYGT